MGSLLASNSASDVLENAFSTVASTPHYMDRNGVRKAGDREGFRDLLKLAQMLDIARSIGLTSVEITTTPANVSSQKVILNNGGVLEYEGAAPETQGGDPHLVYRIHL